MSHHRTRSLAIALVLFLLMPLASRADDKKADLDRDLERLVADYIDLYTKDTLPRWRGLFLPTFVSASTEADGSVEVRDLDAFYGAQERGFAESAAMGERLENVRIERRGAMASVWADFVFWADGPPSRGQLVLVALHGQDGWRFHSLAFSYPD